MNAKRTLIALGICLKCSTSKQVSVLVQERRESGDLDGLWEFPGGKIESFESAEQAMIRELQEEIDLNTQNMRRILFKVHSYDYKDRSLMFYSYLIDAKEIKETKACWINLFDLGTKYPVPAANLTLVEDLKYTLKNALDHNVLELIWAS